VRFLNLLASNDWRLDIDALEDMVSPQTKLIIINTPHNPLGWTLSAHEMARLASIAARNDTYVLFDEHYRYLPLSPGTGLIPSGYDVCRNIWPKTYATGSMIKCFGIVGIRIGWLLGDQAMLNQCRDYKDYLTHTIPMLTDYIALLALRNKEHIIRRKKQDILANLSALNQFMDRQKDVLDYLPPTGGVVCFPRLTLAQDSRDFCQTLLKNHGVSILPGFAFEADQHVRINIGIAAARFQEALNRMEHCLHDYRQDNHGS
jgi:aspartate/methionine/tyrosine aminotransferase